MPCWRYGAQNDIDTYAVVVFEARIAHVNDVLHDSLEP